MVANLHIEPNDEEEKGHASLLDKDRKMSQKQESSVEQLKELQEKKIEEDKQEAKRIADERFEAERLEKEAIEAARIEEADKIENDRIEEERAQVELIKKAAEQERLQKEADIDRQIALLMAQKTELRAAHPEAASSEKGF